MSSAGLSSKFDVVKYGRLVRQLCQEESSPAVKALLPKAAQAGNRSILSFMNKRPSAAAENESEVRVTGENSGATSGVDDLKIFAVNKQQRK
jgi:hypothetical protein